MSVKDDFDELVRRPLIGICNKLVGAWVVGVAANGVLVPELSVGKQ